MNLKNKLFRNKLCITSLVFCLNLQIKAVSLQWLHYCSPKYPSLVTSIGYRGNGKAYTTPTRTLFDRFTLFVYDPFVYPSDI